MKPSDVNKNSNIEKPKEINETMLDAYSSFEEVFEKIRDEYSDIIVKLIANKKVIYIKKDNLEIYIYDRFEIKINAKYGTLIKKFIDSDTYNYYSDGKFEFFYGDFPDAFGYDYRVDKKINKFPCYEKIYNEIKHILNNSTDIFKNIKKKYRKENWSTFIGCLILFIVNAVLLFGLLYDIYYFFAQIFTGNSISGVMLNIYRVIFIDKKRFLLLLVLPALLLFAFMYLFVLWFFGVMTIMPLQPIIEFFTIPGIKEQNKYLLKCNNYFKNYKGLSLRELLNNLDNNKFHIEEIELDNIMGELEKRYTFKNFYKEIKLKDYLIDDIENKEDEFYHKVSFTIKYWYLENILKVPAEDMCYYFENYKLFFMPYYLNTKDVNILFNLNLKNNKYYYFRVYKDNEEIFLTILFSNKKAYLIEMKKDVTSMIEKDDEVPDEAELFFNGDNGYLISKNLKELPDFSKKNIPALDLKNKTLIEKFEIMHKIMPTFHMEKVDDIYISPQNLFPVFAIDDDGKRDFLNELEDSFSALDSHICAELENLDFTMYLEFKLKECILFIEDHGQYYKITFINKSTD